MAVVINEFEVVTGESEAGKREATPASESGQTPPSQREIEQLVEQRIQRGERVWAH